MNLAHRRTELPTKTSSVVVILGARSLFLLGGFGIIFPPCVFLLPSNVFIGFIRCLFSVLLRLGYAIGCEILPPLALKNLFFFAVLTPNFMVFGTKVSVYRFFGVMLSQYRCITIQISDQNTMG